MEADNEHMSTLRKHLIRSKSTVVPAHLQLIGNPVARYLVIGADGVVRHFLAAP